MAERKLLDQVSDLARLKHLSLRTEEAYRNWIKRFIFFHGKRHPRELDAAAVRAFLTHLAVDEHVSASTQNQAFSALLFLYKQVLQIEALDITGVPRARPSRRVPVVFTQDEARSIIAQMKGARRLIAGLLYGSGLRIMEAVRLRIKDLDFQRRDNCQGQQGRKAKSHHAAASAEAEAWFTGRGRAEAPSARFEKRLW